MKQIQFFRSGQNYKAVCADNGAVESVTYQEHGTEILAAEIRLSNFPTSGIEHYIKHFIEALNYELCSREEFLQVRYKVQAATAEAFFEMDGYEQPAKKIYWP